MSEDGSTFTRGKLLRVQRACRALQAIALCTLCIGSPARSAEPPAAATVPLQSLNFGTLFDAASLGPAPQVVGEAEHPQAVSYFKKLEYADLDLSGFVASRTDQNSADYRLYLGVRYMRSLGEAARLSGRTFYGVGTYDGINHEGGALPEEVRASGEPRGGWIGSDWQISSRLFDRTTFLAGVEYRQPLGAGLLNLNELLGRPSPAASDPSGPKVGIVTRGEVALARDLSLKIRMRYDEDPGAPGSSIDPRVELLYKPRQNATLKAFFDQAAYAAPSRERAYYPTLSVAQDSDRIRNYELAYELSLTSQQKLHLSAYRYGVEGLPAYSSVMAVDSSAGIDTTGFEVGMERKNAGGARTRLSYAWLATADSLAGASHGVLERHLTRLRMDIPLLSHRLTTAFELQYLDIAGPLVSERDRGYLIGNFTLASGRLAGATRVSIGIHNMFDARDTGDDARPLPLLPQDGRSLRVDVARRL